MEKYPAHIALTIQQNGLTGISHGLMHGITGLCIFFYHLARQTNNSDYEKIADDLLDKVFANLSNSAPGNFENGLVGIGWGIEYLVQNNFAEGNTDEILEEVDNKVFRALNEENITSFELGSGLTGSLFYLIARLKNKKPPYSMTQRVNRELLILAINKIDDLVTAQFSGIVKETQFDLFWRFPTMLFGLSEAFKLDIYNEKIDLMIRQWMAYFEAYIPSLHINRLFMAMVMAHFNTIIPNKRIEKQIHILLYATNFDQMETEFDPNHQSIRYGWPGAIWLLYMAKRCISPQMPNYNLIIKTHNEYVTRFKSKLEICMNYSPDSPNAFKQGISEGITGIGIIGLMFPDAFKKKKKKSIINS